MRTRQWCRLLIATMVVAALAIMSVGAVSAHARLTASDPVDKAVLTKAPAQITLTFSEETSATKSGGAVLDASGATVSTGFKVDLNQRTKMTIDLKPNLPNGVYTVKWNSFTEDDNGTADGAFTFTIQAQVTSTGTAAGTTPAGGSATAGTAAVATTAPTASAAATSAPTATVAPTATRPATTPAATGTGGTATATPAPATLPKTGNGDSGSSPPWEIVILVAAVVAISGGLVFRLRIARR